MDVEPNRVTSSKEFFTRHAQGYAKSKGHASGPDLSALIDALDPKLFEVALDIATGTGFTAIELSRRVKSVVATDITEKMLEEARKLSSESKITNITFEFADAAKLPCANSSFDIVTSRRAVHHFTELRQFLKEASRVMKPRGRIGIADMSFPEGTQVFFNRIEKLRDPSHVRAYTEVEWRRILKECGLKLTHLKMITYHATLGQWMYPVEIDGEKDAAVAMEWEKLDDKSRELLGARFESERVASFNRSHIVLTATI